MTRAALAAGMLTLFACAPQASREGSPETAAETRGADAGAADPRPESEKVVHIEEDMLRDLRITTTAVESRSAGESAAVLGELHVDEERYAEVASPIAAQAVRLLAAAGDRVSGGAALLELASLEVGKARGSYAEAEARRQLAAHALARKRGLAEERIAPQREVQEAEAEWRAADAGVASARAALESLGVSAEVGDGGRFLLRAPVGGVVLERDVLKGQVVEPSRALFRIGDLSRLWLVAHASERDALRVPAGSQARVTFPALPGRRFEGRIVMVGRQVDGASRTIPIRLHVANEDGMLRPGMSATVWLPIGEGGPLLSVPSAALQRLHDSWCVFVPQGGGSFEVRPVGRGRDLGGEVEVLSGLAAGETVVVEGAFLLKAEGEKAEGEGGHHDH
jgi:cobalt-zinc-cadmium efflux system membrane fusion protein